MIKLESLGKLERLGFYDMQMIMKCPFTYYSKSAVTNPKLKGPGPTLSMVQGNLFHQLAEDVDSISDSRVRLERALQITENLYKELKQKEEYWWLTDLSKNTKVRSLINSVVFGPLNNGAIEEGTKKFEIELQSNDGRFVGRLDKLVISGKKAIVTEYKSSFYQMTEDIINAYKEQVTFYASLVFQNFQIAEVTGVVVDKDLRRHDFTILKDSAFELLNRYSAEIEKIEGYPQSNIEDLQVATPDNCLNCRLKPICRSFKSKEMHFGNFDGAIAEGVISDVSTIPPRFLKLELQQTSIFIPQSHPFSKVATRNEYYTFVDLRRSNGSLEVTNRTQIYGK